MRSVISIPILIVAVMTAAASVCVDRILSNRVLIVCPVCGEALASNVIWLKALYWWPVDTCKNCGYLFPVGRSCWLFGKSYLHEINMKELNDDVAYYAEPIISFYYDDKSDGEYNDSTENDDVPTEEDDVPIDENDDSIRVDETCPD